MVERAEGAARSATGAYVVLVVAMFIASANPVVGRGIIQDVPPFALCFWRFVAAAVALAPFAMGPLHQQQALFRRQWKRLAAMGFIGFSSYNAFLYLGVQTTTAINAALITTMAPVAILAITWVIHRERIGAIGVAGMVLGLLGVAVTVTHGDLAILYRLDLVPGDLLMILAVLGFAFYSLLLRQLEPGTNPIAFMLIVDLWALLAVTPFYLWELAQGQSFAVTWGALGAILYVGVMATAVSFTMYTQAASVVGASAAAQVIYLTPVFASVMAVVFLGESFGWHHVLGAAFICGGIYLSTRALRVRRV